MYDISNAPRRTIRAQGHAVSVPAPFAAGQTLDETLAGVLNQTYAENVRNNVASQIRTKIEAGETLTDEQVQAMFDEYVAGYVFGQTGGRSGPVDPVERRARQLAEGKVKEAIRAQGYKLADIGKEKIEAYINQLLEQNPAFYDEAKRQITAEQKAAAKLDIGGLDLG